MTYFVLGLPCVVSPQQGVGGGGEGGQVEQDSLKKGERDGGQCACVHVRLSVQHCSATKARSTIGIRIASLRWTAGYSGGPPPPPPWPPPPHLLIGSFFFCGHFEGSSFCDHF